jgi:hypothetical protein
MPGNKIDKPILQPNVGDVGPDNFSTRSEDGTEEQSKGVVSTKKQLGRLH